MEKQRGHDSSGIKEEFLSECSDHPKSNMITVMHHGTFDLILDSFILITVLYCLLKDLGLICE